MNILFVGVLDIPWSTNLEMKNSLTEMGHRVDEFNYRSVAKANIPWWQDNPCFAVLLNKVFSRFREVEWLPSAIRDLYFSIQGRPAMHALLQEKAKNGNYDLILFLKVDTINPLVITEITKKTKTWYYFMDPIDIAKKINAARYAKACTHASATFSDVWGVFLDSNPNSYWITQGVDPNLFFPDERVKKSIDVMFAGTKTRGREDYIHRIRMRGIEVCCYGKGWENPPIYQSDLVNKYRQSRIVLNLCRMGRGFSIRVFQVMGTGAFLLSEYCHDLGHFFDRGKELDWFYDGDELVERVSYYLKNEKEREVLAKQGCLHVHKRNSWKDQIAKIIEISEDV